MRLILPTLLLLTLCGCNINNQLILREPVPHEEYISKRTGTLYEETSYWDIARAVDANSPTPNSHISKKGSITFSGSKYREKFDFSYKFESPNNWHIIFFKKEERQFSLHFNKLGLTFQDVHDEIFIQSHESKVWEKLKDHLYLNNLKTVAESLKSPSFDPSLDWIAEVDGLQYFVIARSLEENQQDIKEEIYFHKKAKSMRRKLKTTFHVGIVEDVTYRSYRDVENSYLPHSIIIQYPTMSERVDISISSIKVEEHAEPEGQLKEL